MNGQSMEKTFSTTDLDYTENDYGSFDVELIATSDRGCTGDSSRYNRTLRKTCLDNSNWKWLSEEYHGLITNSVIKHWSYRFCV